MIKFISSKAACILCKDEDLDEMRELYEYAIYILLSGLFHLISVVALGLCFNMVLESLVFYCSFILIRKFAGGYHAKTPTRCYVFSIATSFAVFCLIKVVYFFYCTGLSICLLLIELVCTLFIVLVVPLQSDNKPLNFQETKLYKNVSRIAVVALFVTSIILAFFGIKFIFVPIIFGVYMCGIVLAMRKIQVLNKSKR